MGLGNPFTGAPERPFPVMDQSPTGGVGAGLILQAYDGGDYKTHSAPDDAAVPTGFMGARLGTFRNVVKPEEETNVDPPFVRDRTDSSFSGDSGFESSSSTNKARGISHESTILSSVEEGSLISDGFEATGTWSPSGGKLPQAHSRAGHGDMSSLSQTPGVSTVPRMTDSPYLMKVVVNAVHGTPGNSSRKANRASRSTSSLNTAHRNLGRVHSRSETSKKYATEDQWVAHRGTIQALYEASTLKEVISTMEREHNFYGTLKMYKNHFRKWGLDNKHIKSRDAVEVALRKHPRDLANKPSKIFVRGRCVEWDEIVRHLKRNGCCHVRLDSNAIGFDSNTADIIVRTPTPEPIPFVLRTHDDLHTAEELGKILCDYATGALETGLWVIDGGQLRVNAGGPVRFWSWVNLGLAATQLLRTGQHRAGFAVLDRWLNKATEMIREQDPTLLKELVRIVLKFTAEQGLQAIVQQHLAATARVVLGPNHPFTVFWMRLRGKSRVDSLRLASLAFSPMLDTLEHRLEPDSLFLIEHRYFHLGWQLEVGQIEPESHVRGVQRLLLRPGNDAPLPLQLQFQLAVDLANTGKVRAAEQVMHRASQSDLVQSDSPHYQPGVEWVFNQTTARIHRAAGRHVEAERACAEWVRVSEQMCGRTHDLTIAAMQQWRNILAYLKRAQEADAVSRAIEERCVIVVSD